MISHSKTVLTISVILCSLSFGIGYSTGLISNFEFNSSSNLMLLNYKETLALTAYNVLTQNLKVCFLLLLGAVTFGATLHFKI
jgi:hypothetical protein